MKTSIRCSCTTALLLSCLFATPQLRAQGTAFIYQGRLDLDGVPVSGSFDLRFTVYDALTSGGIAGGPLTNSSVSVSNGLFAAGLDFGGGVFTGPARWLQIEVRTNGVGSFTLLSPRQPLAATPYAIHAGNASNVVNGAVVKSLNNLRDSVAIAAGANVTLATNGSTLTISSTGPGGNIWSLNGANTYYSAGNVGVGTSTPQGLLDLFTGNASDTSALFVRADPSSYGRGGILHHQSATYAWQELAQNTGSDTDGYLTFHYVNRNAPGTKVASDVLALRANGNVGIGTTTPSARLSVFSSTASALDNTAVFYAPALGGTASHIHYGLNGDWYIRSANSLGKVVLQDFGGNVGIGTQTPATKLTVNASSPGFGVEHTDGSVRLGTYIDASGGWLGTISNHKLHFYVNNSVAKMTMDTAGSVGIGTQTPGSKLDVVGDTTTTRLILRADPLATANAAVLCADAGVVNFVPYNTALARPLNLIVRDATVRQLTITGGADLAEPFKMSSDSIPKGAVVVIDEDNPGHLEMSTEAYDRRVAGIVSGANGVRPGISLHQEGEIEGGENVALSGRVYVQADAAFGMIKPGDLLTTSDTPGHAMKVTDHARAQGAILGKAMTGLKEGKGMVLVLVTLQ